MPFTVFHMGPGILIKSLLRGSFSLMVFGWSQILMDIQPLIALTTGIRPIHGFTHTFLGATLIAFIAAFTGKWLSEWFVSNMCHNLGRRQRALLDIPDRIKLWVAVLSSFTGAYSHVILDGLMHGDMEPFYPFTKYNGLLHQVSTYDIHLWCVYTGLAGGAIYFLVRYSLVRKVSDEG